MELAGYMGGTWVTPFQPSTLVPPLRNVGPIGRKDRSWQTCSVEYKVSPVEVCAI
jgi:hypothetical protein